MTYTFQTNRKYLSAGSIISTISKSFSSIPDDRTSINAKKISVHDASMSAFAMMHLKDSSLLSFEREKTELEVRHNLEHLYQVKNKAPCDTSMREIIDPLDSLILKTFQKLVVSSRESRLI